MSRPADAQLRVSTVTTSSGSISSHGTGTSVAPDVDGRPPYIISTISLFWDMITEQPAKTKPAIYLYLHASLVSLPTKDIS
jgi:hypothetical protein